MLLQLRAAGGEGEVWAGRREGVRREGLQGVGGGDAGVEDVDGERGVRFEGEEVREDGEHRDEVRCGAGQSVFG